MVKEGLEKDLAPARVYLGLDHAADLILIGRRGVYSAGHRLRARSCRVKGLYSGGGGERRGRKDADNGHRRASSPCGTTIECPVSCGFRSTPILFASLMTHTHAGDRF